jgi:hypothetical protein
MIGRRIHVPGDLGLRMWKLALDARGQATSEYVTLAGVLVLTGLVISGILSDGLRAFVRGALLNVRTIAP